MLNRAQQPEFKKIEKIDYIKAQKLQLTNGIPVYTINAGTQDLVKVEFIFNAGSLYQDAPLMASSTNSMLLEGTKHYHSAQISEKFDFYGSYLQLDSGHHTASVTLFTLNKYINETLSLVEDLIKNSVFPEKEFSTYIQKRKQRFIIDCSKVQKIARDNFNEALFGENHPYGKYYKLEDFDKINHNHLINFHKNHYNSNNCKIIVSGKINDEILNLLNKLFGGDDWKSNKNIITNDVQISSAETKKIYVEKADAVQCALRVGKVLFNKLHPDYISLDFVNTILGGYFGSRLMSNIRENKGYTYGIGSALISYQQAGYLIISSEVGKNVWKESINEIYHEIRRLKDELVSEDEMNIVRNYALGEILRAFDGPLALSAAFKSLIDYGLDYDYFDRYIETIKTINSQQVRELANTYFDENSMYEVVAGT